jgi:hypothetical protein
MREYTRWAILWPSENKLDGKKEYLLGTTDTQMTQLFLTREEARKDKNLTNYNAMLRKRPDLRREPHGWRARRPVKVKVTVEQI